MEAAPPDRARGARSRRRRIALRRAGALAAAVLATAAVWLLAFRDEGGEADRGSGGGAGAVSKPVANLVAEMSLGERVDQILLLGFEGTDASAPIAATLEERQLGGVLIARRNWIDPVQGVALTGFIRATGLADGRISPLIVTQQEGAAYNSLAGLPPSSRQLDIGRGGDPLAAESWARGAAAELRAAGIDLNLSPVADVATIASPLAGRSFSDDSAVAAELVAGATRGCAQGGIACAPLHFPGQGAASESTDEGPATVSLDSSALAGRDLAAFRAAFAERAPAVVLSLAYFAAYDPVTPAALAPEIATDLLRDEMRFAGLAITDDLSAGAIKATQSVASAAVAAVAAGADMAQISSPDDQPATSEALLEAVQSGQITEERLNEAAGRVLELKREQGLLRL